MTSTLQAFRYHIQGRVQGVGFRYFTLQRARALNIRGRVRNDEDGSVTAWALGEAEHLAAFQQALAQGPRSSNVLHIGITQLNPDDLRTLVDFTIVR